MHPKQADLCRPLALGHRLSGQGSFLLSTVFAMLHSLPQRFSAFPCVIVSTRDDLQTVWCAWWMCKKRAQLTNIKELFGPKKKHVRDSGNGVLHIKTDLPKFDQRPDRCTVRPWGRPPNEQNSLAGPSAQRPAKSSSDLVPTLPRSHSRAEHKRVGSCSTTPGQLNTTSCNF